MKTARLFTMAMVAVILLGTSIQAQDAAPDRRARPVKRERGEHLKNLFDKMVKELDLTAEQQTQIKQILDTHRQAMENWLKENGEDLKALREEFKKARKEGNKEALKTLHEKRVSLLKGRREMGEAMHKQVNAVLTDEQKKKFEKGRRTRQRAMAGAQMVLRALGQVGLSDEQEAKIKKIVAETKNAAGKVESPKEKGQLWQKAVKAIKSDVLSDEQAKKFEQSMLRMGRRRNQMRIASALNLTDEQKEQGKKIREKYRDKIKEAEGRKERRELMEQMRKELESILTDEQKAKAREHRRNQRQRFRKGIADALKLTDEQKQQMEKIEAKYRDKIKNADSREDRGELIKKMREEMGSILTDEQKEKAKKHREERKKRWQERRGRRGKGQQQGRRRGRPGPDNE